MRIVSYGSASSTYLLDDSGAPLNLGESVVEAIVIAPITQGHAVRATLTIAFVNLDIRADAATPREHD